jgi:hypothetical protein
VSEIDARTDRRAGRREDEKGPITANLDHLAAVVLAFIHHDAREFLRERRGCLIAALGRPRSGLLLALSGAVIGLAVGALFGLLTHWLIGGEQHDFSSVMGLQANRYYLLAEEHVAAEAARRLLA